MLKEMLQRPHWKGFWSFCIGNIATGAFPVDGNWTQRLRPPPGDDEAMLLEVRGESTAPLVQKRFFLKVSRLNETEKQERE